MPGIELYWIMLIFLLILIAASSVLLWKILSLMTLHQTMMKNLLDRIQSQDLPTYQTMSRTPIVPTQEIWSSKSEDNEVPDPETFAALTDGFDEEYYNAQFDLGVDRDG